jgi:diguanylate cyclase (GGDEF)-like protein
MLWDFFVSHAFEDKEFARTLADALSEKGYRVWFDEFELRIGDSLRRSIDLGLSRSRFGIVVLSPHFFAKEWTQKELDALTARETTKKRIVLPIWHNISLREVRKYSPTLADRFAISSTGGIKEIVQQLTSVVEASTANLRDNKAKDTKQFQIDSDQFVSELERIKHSLAVKETELKAVIAQADEISNTDELTGMPNRRRINADLQREVMFSERYGTPLSISILELDNLKQIRDSYGHITGDDVLRSVATILRQYINHPDMIGRHGGEVFLLVLPHTTLDNASKLAQSLCEQIRSTLISSNGRNFHATASLGIAQYKIHEEDWRGLLERADQALYEAKNSGRDQ